MNDVTKNNLFSLPLTKPFDVSLGYKDEKIQLKFEWCNPEDPYFILRMKVDPEKVHVFDGLTIEVAFRGETHVIPGFNVRGLSKGNRVEFPRGISLQEIAVTYSSEKRK